uniref:poly(A)-specific ribonuclease n=1 Tax=Panagrellus redivivus TaxID=6233 RepID=A0A7E4VVK5_PANRE
MSERRTATTRTGVNAATQTGDDTPKASPNATPKASPNATPKASPSATPVPTSTLTSIPTQPPGPPPPTTSETPAPAPPAPPKPNVVIHEVWASNLDEEFINIRKLVGHYPYVAFDTEFPGVVATPVGVFRNKDEFQYTQMSHNVNLLKVIQIGICLVNKDGELPPKGDIWQFNFKFTTEKDMYSIESVNLLRRSGIDFEKNRTLGIRLEEFGALLTTSGLVANEEVTWLTFHSCFDYGYLIKSIIIKNLPPESKDFIYLHKILFPRSFDIKVLMKAPNIQSAQLHGGLQDIADQLSVERFGAQHQAGSDSLLTAKTFFKLRSVFFHDSWDKVAEVVEGLMFGLTKANQVSFEGLPLTAPINFRKPLAYLPKPRPERIRDPPRPSKLLSVVNPKTMQETMVFPLPPPINT